MEEITWELREGGTPPTGSYRLSSLEQTPSGLHIAATEDGVLSWDTPIPFDADVIRLHTISKKPSNGGLVWNTKTNTQGQMDFLIPAGEKDIALSLRDDDTWNWKTTEFGIGFGAQADVTLQSITWEKYSVAEKMAEAWKSFWTFDTFKPYSINFLWGPLLAFEPHARATLFDSQPPPSWSATRLFYLIMLIALFVSALIVYTEKNAGKRKAGRVMIITFIALWILFDLRMGMEQIAYAMRDIRQYVLQAPEKKSLRDNGQLNAFADTLIPFLKQYDRYVVIEPKDSPLFRILRYASYPSLPIHKEDDTKNVKLWIVVERPDITVDAEGRLIDGEGKVLTAAGEILAKPALGTFIFAIP